RREESERVGDSFGVDRPALDECRVPEVAVERMDVGPLEGDGELEVVAGNSFVECEAFHAELLAGCRGIGEVNVKNSGTSAVFRGRFIVRQGLGRLLKRRER